jgi:hypothetical protein
LVSILDVIAEPINLYSDLSNDMIKKVSKGKYIGLKEQYKD